MRKQVEQILALMEFAFQQRKQRESVLQCSGGAVYLSRIKVRKGNSIYILYLDRVI